MKALILNSGTGSRMGDFSSSHPKCMTTLMTGQTILSRQIAQLEAADISDIIITTGPFSKALERHARDCAVSARLTFVNNPRYAQTNYIYSIYLALELLEGNLLMLHGDLVFSDSVLRDIVESCGSAMAVSSSLPLPPKDFKAVIKDGLITAVGVDFFDRALVAQPLYKLNDNDWQIWAGEIIRFIETGQTTCYAENAFNKISRYCKLWPLDIKDRLCAEVDTPEDLKQVNLLMRIKDREG